MTKFLARGELVGIREVTLDDSPLIYEIWHDLSVQHNLNWDGREESYQQWQEQALNWRSWLDCIVISLDDGRPAGQVSLGSIKTDPELVVLLLPGYRGRGLGTEAARLILDYGFAAMGISRVGGGAYNFNNDSQRMLDKLGFVRDPSEDEAEDNAWGEGKVTQLCYHLDRDTWQQTRNWQGRARPAVFDARPALETIKQLNFERVCGGEGEARAMKIIAEQLGKIGVQWRYHTFEDRSVGTEQQVNRQFKNLIADIPGTVRSDESVIMGAHIDSWPGTVGASDDAAGCAILLEAAKWFATNPPERMVRLAWFTGEEVDARGSRAYVRDYIAEPVMVKLMVNVDSGCEMYTGGFSVCASDESVVEWARLRLDLRDMDHFITQGGSTDAKSFIECGVPAFFAEAPSKQSEHLPDDDPEHIDPHKLQFLGSISLGAVSCAANDTVKI